MIVTVLQRGGLSVYGGSYDPKRQVVITDTDQQQAVEINYPATISSAALSENGIDAGTPTVSGQKASFTISGTGSLEIVAIMGSDRPKVVIEAESVSHRTDYAG